MAQPVKVPLLLILVSLQCTLIQLLAVTLLYLCHVCCNLPGIQHFQKEGTQASCSQGEIASHVTEGNKAGLLRCCDPVRHTQSGKSLLLEAQQAETDLTARRHTNPHPQGLSTTTPATNGQCRAQDTNKHMEKDTEVLSP